MHKSERLFHLVTLLRGRRTAITAERLAEVLEVSVRTVYRDIQSLSLSGVPIEGEAGVGYMLPKSFDLPPLMFSFEEMQSLLLGSQMVQAWTDPELAKASDSAAEKIRAVLPEPLLQKADALPYRVPGREWEPETKAKHQVVRRAIEQRSKLHFEYRDGEGRISQRVIWPLGMVFWGDRWTLLAWCEHRAAYRNFRLDRIVSQTTLADCYPQHPQRNLSHYLAGLGDHI